jgi:hypothetical protein
MKTALLAAKVVLLVVCTLVLSLIVFLGIGLAADKMALRRIDHKLHVDLSMGASSTKIESALVEEKLEFSFDHRQNRYQAIYRPKWIPLIPRGDVCVYVYVDEAKRLTRIEDVVAYTFL